MNRGDIGRHVFGVAAICFGIVALLWHDFDTWQQLASLWSAAGGPVLVTLLALAEIAGGVAVQFAAGKRFGATVLGAVYLIFAVRWLPAIVAGPLTYGNWGNLFEQLSLVSASMIVYASTLRDEERARRLGQAGRYLFALCALSFSLEQAFYLSDTASFVPAWIPPNQMFWAVLTTLAFGLAAIAIASGAVGSLAATLTTAMILVFGALVWLPVLIAHPQQHMNWAGNAQNLLIAGAAWVTADFLARLDRGEEATLVSRG